MGRLLLLFILVPTLELALLIEVGTRIGLLPTLGLIVATGAAGAYLARRQGLGVLKVIQSDMARGRLPAGPMVDGLIILMAAALLLTPGILTDAVGFLLLIPASRSVLKSFVWKRLKKAVQEGRMRYEVHVDRESWSRSQPIDVTPRRSNSEEAGQKSPDKLPTAAGGGDPTEGL